MKEKSHSYEQKITKFWTENKIYEKLKEKNSKNELFNHLDGPPFPTGELHVGHLRNWSIKDCILRFKRLQGYNVYVKDGYDVHGLPVENKVQKQLNLKTVKELKEFGEENFVKECKKFVAKILNDMTDLRNQFGLWMDRDHYQTSHPDYVSMCWQFFKKAHEKGLLYKDYKTVAWCPHDETTLSDYEIKDTYKTISDPSIYVKFPIKKEHWKTTTPESLLIWTTTPWTLQSNMAIVVNPKFNYARVLVEINGKEEILIIAEKLVEKVIKTLKKSTDIEAKSIQEVVPGIELEGIKYNHIYLDETPSQQDFAKLDHKHIHSVICGDFVTLDEGEDILEKLEKRGYKHSNKEKNNDNQEKSQAKSKSEGTGLVHCAPGHGFEDNEIGRAYNIPTFCPVGPNGKFTEGKYEGTYFKDVDPIAIDYLKEKGFLLHSSMKSHRYPCCWRCKTPIVYRAAEQWWIKRSAFIDDIIKQNKNVKWLPDSAKVSFDNLMSNAGDWAISRQRFWGIPLPIFEDEDGNFEVIGSKEELEQRTNTKLDDIHRDDIKNLKIKNQKTGKVMKAVPFITDVWFDSGCASFASHYNEGLSFDEIIDKYYPIKWITESEDQIRGWFSSLFNVGYVVTGKAPYNEVLYYRFVMDKTGKEKMSKSLANGVSGNEAIELWGADKTRYYLLNKRLPEEQINFDPDEMSIIDGIFNTIENSLKFIFSYTSKFDGDYSFYEYTNLEIEDKWILYRLNKTLETFTRLLDGYRINHALGELEDFIIKDLSKTYLKLIKKRTDSKDEKLLFTLFEITKKVLMMLSCSMPFKAEQIYQDSPIKKKESIFLENFPQADDLIIHHAEKESIPDSFNTCQEIIQAILNSREQAKIGVRWPLAEVNIVTNYDIKDKLKNFEPLIKDLTNIKKIEYGNEDININYIVKPNFKELKQDFKDNLKEAIKIINTNKFYIAKDLKKGLTKGNIEGLELDYEKHILKEIELPEDLIASSFSLGSIILHTKQDEVLLESGYLRETIRRIQDQRKKLGLKKKDEIFLCFSGSENYFLNLVKDWHDSICKTVGAKDIWKEGICDLKEKYKIKDKELVVGIKKI